jgi:hypothetical protein
LEEDKAENVGLGNSMNAVWHGRYLHSMRCTVHIIWVIFLNFGLRIIVQCREETLLLVMKLWRTGGFSLSTSWEPTVDSHEGAVHCGKR